MKTERQQDQDVAERLRRENLERANAPKDNKVDDTPHWGDLMRELRSKVPEGLAPLVDRLSFACDQRLSFLLHERYEQDLSHAATVAELRAEVERLRTDAYKFRRLARLLDGFDFRLGRNVLMPPATYLDSVEITCEFQPGVGQSMIDAIMDTLTGADPT